MTTSISDPWRAIDSLDADLTVSDGVHGFGGLHGGIGVAIATRHLTAAVDDDTKPLRSLHARFRRPIRGSLHVAEPQHSPGRLVDTASTTIETGGRPALTVDATFGRPTLRVSSHPPDVPLVLGPDQCDEFELPTEFVPFGQFVEIRPTTTARPFGAASEPRLQAWIRLRDDAPVDVSRFIVLIDALAPSAAASLSDLVAIPTVELTVRPAPNLAAATSPWILLDTVSVVSADGWVHETLTAWDPDGDHLGSATQLRVMNPV